MNLELTEQEKEVREMLKRHAKIALYALDEMENERGKLRALSVSGLPEFAGALKAFSWQAGVFLDKADHYTKYVVTWHEDYAERKFK